ncbi:MAG: hypothetical protein JRI25_28675 [Deltaproteobacteria bacterium]|nr:hypothetical protein [Deltaproteobacteria bacterium]
MDRLILLLVLLGCGGSAPPQAPVSAPQPPAPEASALEATSPEATVPEATDPAASESGPETPEPTMSEWPEGCCLLEVSVAETGYRMRIHDDGRWTEVWPTVPERESQQFRPTSPSESAEARRLEELRTTWSGLLATHHGQTLGPFVTEGTKLPGGRTVKAHSVTFRTASHTVQVTGDLNLASSMGPLEEAWSSLSKELWGPMH